MEAIIRHSPITRDGPIYSIYGNGRFPVAVYRTCCAKGSKAQSTVTHADPTHSGTRGFSLAALAARHEHLCFTICTQKRGRGRLCYRICAAAPRLHHLVPPHLTILCLHKPPKHNVAVPINKVEGRLGGANPVFSKIFPKIFPKFFDLLHLASCLKLRSTTGTSSRMNTDSVFVEICSQIIGMVPWFRPEFRTSSACQLYK